MPKKCIVQQHEIDDLIIDDFNAVLTAVKLECVASGSDMGSVLSHPELGNAYDAVVRAIAHLQIVGQEAES